MAEYDFMQILHLVSLYYGKTVMEGVTYSDAGL